MQIDGFQCDACKNIGQRDAFRSQNHTMGLPVGWMVLGLGADTDILHFCSRSCLAAWLSQEGMPAHSFHSSETRRFLLVEKGPNADFIECVKWPSGYVSIDPEKAKMNEPWCHTDWERFKREYPDRTVHWIDSEDKS